MVKFKNMIPARLRRVRQVSPNSEPKYDQNQVMYNLYEQGSVAVHPCEPFETVSGEEISHRMEIDHCVKRAPTLAELMSDRERDRETNVYSVIGSRALLSREVDALTREDFSVQTEQQTISALFSGLCARSDDLARTSRLSKIRNHLNYVGEPELMEAACGIATYWKHRLDAHPDKTLFVMLGEINNMERADYAAPQGKIKSDEYFMELIMGEFSDDELSQYVGRLLIDEHELANVSKENVDIIMLDDWTSSGTEIMEQQQCFLRRHPDLRDHIEVQLAIANEERLKVGFRMSGGSMCQSARIIGQIVHPSFLARILQGRIRRTTRWRLISALCLEQRIRCHQACKLRDHITETTIRRPFVNVYNTLGCMAQT